MPAPRVAVVNRSSIRFPGDDPFAVPLPGSEVVVLNVARALAAAGCDVAYFGHVDAGEAWGVRFRPVAAMRSLDDGADLRVLWVRDYHLSDVVFAGFPHARHVLLTEDSVRDMEVLFGAGLAGRLGGYVDRFAAVVFASQWHLDDWRAGFGIEVPHGRVIHNLASHVPWSEPPGRRPARVVHTSHPRKALAAVAAIARRLAGTGFSVTCSGDPTLYQDETCRVAHPDGAGGWVDRGSFADFAAANEDVIEFRPPAPVAGMADFLGGHDVLLHPDYSGETGAVVAIEALRRGLVPVVSRLGALPELVGEAGIALDGDSWEPGFADRAAAAIRGLQDQGVDAFASGRAAARDLLDTPPLVARWRAALDLP